MAGVPFQACEKSGGLGMRGRGNACKNPIVFCFFFLAEPSNPPATILSSIESVYVLSNPFPSKPLIVFHPINHPTVSLTIPLGNLDFFGAYVEQFS